MSLNQGWQYREQVQGADAGKTVLDYYSDRYRHSSPTAWQNRIEAGQICLDGQPTTPETPLRAGQWLTYDRPPWQEPDVPLDFQVVYADPDLLVINKPAGLPVLPGGGFLNHTLLGQLQRLYPLETPLPIHRLGRGTSGLMLLARTPLARANLSQQMRSQQICKTYRALIAASDLPDQFTITQAIGKIDHPILGYIYAATADGKPARSDGRVLERRSQTTLLEVTIHTGRPHQIRIHLATVGYPLIGDPLYGVGGIPLISVTESKGKLPVPGDCGYHLHAYQLGFNHPCSGERLYWSCPPPLELRQND